MSADKKHYPLSRRLLKILLWTVMGVALFFYGLLTCLVSVLSPDRLTPLVSVAANRYLDADVALSRMEFTAMSSYPFLRLEIDSLSVVSRQMAAAKADTALHIPSYADTLLTFDRFVGEIELPKLAAAKISINNVEIVAPSINLFTVSDSLSNFDIFPASAEDKKDDESPVLIPDIEVRRFAIERPGLIRYHDGITGNHIDLQLEALLSKNGAEPRYRLEFGGNVATPLLDMLRMTDIDFSLNGDIDWNSSNPYEVEIRDLEFSTPLINARFDLAADFTDKLLLERFSMETDTVDVGRLLACVPDSLSEQFHTDALRTDAHMLLKARLDSVYDLGRDTIPFATLDILIPECSLRYGHARFEKFAVDLGLTLRGDNLGNAVVDLRSLNVAGPATDLNISMKATDLTGDPLADLSVKGYTDLAKLPPPLMRYINGYLSGKLKLDLDVSGRMSMLTQTAFHRLAVDGVLDAERLYWLSADTANMAYINEAGLKFGTEESVADGQRLLAAVVKVDSADVLTGGLGITATDFSLGFGVDKTKLSSDTTKVVPMGGGLKIGSLNLNSITDSAGVRIRNVDGRVVMRRFKEMERVPEFMFDLAIGRMAAGSPDGRMLFSKSRLNFTAHKLPLRRATARMRRIVDSIRTSRPDLPMDSVYRLALERSARNRKPYHRVHAAATDTASEIIDWGTSKFVDKLLLRWAIDGSLTARRSRLFTPHFPLRNVLKGLDIRFNNDSIILDSVAYKVGRSDFMAVGKITNLRRALTSRTGRQRLKLDFETLSDTVDVNQIAEAFFRGAAYSSDKQRPDLSIVDNENDFENGLDDFAVADDASAAPVLVPVNIEADLKLRARNVLYSDLLLHDFTGDVLVYDGAINLHKLQAASEIGSVNLSALYSAPDTTHMYFGFGLNVDGFDIARFLKLVPAVDSIMPLLRDISGIINADVAATVKLDSHMNFDLPSLTAAIKLQGDSLQLLDRETFRTIAKWLMFKNKQRNIIDRMTVEMVVADNEMYLYPFVFDIDRYRLGVQGHNDLALNFNYLVSVLKSPLPFKFGITLKGNPDDYKIRLGRAKFNEKQAVERKLVVDTARINLVDQIESVFRRGVRNSKFARLDLPAKNTAAEINLNNEPVTASDSLLFIREGLIPAPAAPEAEPQENKKE